MAASISATTHNTCHCCKCAPATLSCRTRGGVVTLCGQPEFDPSSPPRYYKTVKTTGEMYTGIFDESLCLQDAGVTFSPITWSGANDYLGDGTYSGFFEFELARSGTGYTLKFVSGHWTKSDGHNGGFVSASVAGNIIAPGATSGVIAGGTYTIVLSFLLFGSRTGFVGVGPITIGHVPLLSIRDTWDTTDDYAAGLAEEPSLCYAQRDMGDSERASLAGGEFPLTGGGTVADPLPSLFSVTPPDAYPGRVDVTEEATTRTSVGDEQCVLNTLTGDYEKVQGELTEELSDEDTEADAIARLLASDDGAWSSWRVVGDGTGGTCVNPACCTALIEARGDSASFLYQESQWRVTKGGLTPSAAYEAHVAIWRREYGSLGPYIKYATMIVPGTANGSGNIQIDGTVPNDAGYETYAAAACLEAVAA